MKLRIALCAAIAACTPSSAPTTTTVPTADPCRVAETKLADAAKLQADGYLGRALPHTERALLLCVSDRTRAAHAEALAELWIDEAGLARYARESTEEQRASARLLYQAGQILRLVDHDYELSQQRLEESYAAAPHPLTIVQMGLSHQAAGRTIEYRKHNARALAVAERTRDASAVAVLQAGHQNSVNAVAFHPSRPIVATATWGGAVFLWDLTSGRILYALNRDWDGSVWFAFSPDGTLFAANVAEGVRLWDVSTGEVVRTFDHGADVYGFSFAHEGARVTTIGGGEVKRWEVASGALLGSFEGGGDLSPDGTRLVSFRDGRMSLFDPETGADLGASAPYTGRISYRAFSPDGARVALGTDGDTIAIIDLASGTTIRTISDHRDSRDLAFSPDGARLASISYGRVTLWDIESGDEVRSIAHPGYVNAVAFGPTGEQLVTAASTIAWVWDVGDGAKTHTLSGLGTGVSSVAFSPDGARLGSASDDATIKLWGLHSGVANQLLDHQVSFAFGAGGAFATMRKDDMVLVWDAKIQSIAHRLMASEDGGLGDGYSNGWVGFSPDGKQLAAVGNELPLTLWSATGEFVWQAYFGVVDPAIVAFEPDSGGLLVPVDLHYKPPYIALMDASTGQEREAFAEHDWRIGSMALRSDGQNLAVARGAAIEIWDVHLATKTGTLKGDVDEVDIPSLAYSPDGSLLASAAGNVVDLWDADAGAIRHRLVGHDNRVTSVAFSSDGTRLASGSADKTIKLWDVGAGTLVATLFATSDGQWLITTPDDRVDGSPGDDGGASLMYWRVGNVQLPGYVGWQRNSSPGLMHEVLGSSFAVRRSSRSR